METPNQPVGGPFPVAPYLDVLLQRLNGGDRRAEVAFGRHVHWGYWPDAEEADGSPEDYAVAAERLCRKVCDAAGVRDGMRVLDVGCGLGGTIASLNERFNHLDLVGVNIDPRQLLRAAKMVRPGNHNRIRFQQADACDLPFDDASFDAVLAVESAFHFPSRAEFLLGAARVLVSGGRLAVSDFVPPAPALPTLRLFNPGQDEATRLSYGAVNLLCPVGEYRLLAGAAGLTLLAAENITANTMPTCDFLRADHRQWPDRTTARMHERATGRLELACRENLLNYTILSFGRISANTSAAA